MSSQSAASVDAVGSVLPDWVDDKADQFEAAWKGVTPPALIDFLGDESGERRVLLFGELVRVDMAYRERLGQRPQLSDYLADFPELGDRFREAAPVLVSSETTPAIADDASARTPPYEG